MTKRSLIKLRLRTRRLVANEDSVALSRVTRLQGIFRGHGQPHPAFGIPIQCDRVPVDPDGQLKIEFPQRLNSATIDARAQTGEDQRV